MEISSSESGHPETPTTGPSPERGDPPTPSTHPCRPGHGRGRSARTPRPLRVSIRTQAIDDPCATHTPNNAVVHRPQTNHLPQHPHVRQARTRGHHPRPPGTHSAPNRRSPDKTPRHRPELADPWTTGRPTALSTARRPATRPTSTEPIRPTPRSLTPTQAQEPLPHRPPQNADNAHYVKLDVRRPPTTTDTPPRTRSESSGSILPSHPQRPRPRRHRWPTPGRTPPRTTKPPSATQPSHRGGHIQDPPLRAPPHRTHPAPESKNPTREPATRPGLPSLVAARCPTPANSTRPAPGTTPSNTSRALVR